METIIKIIENGIYNIFAERHAVLGWRYMAGLAVVVLICAIGPYLLGSINWAIIISKRLYGTDVRTCGSGNAGMTNMFRSFGKRAGILTFLGDTGKTVVSVAVGYLLLGYSGAYIAGTFCVIGHVFPIYYKFKGGKGVLTTAIMVFMLDPLVFAVLALVFLIVLIGTRFVSLSSVMAALLFPLVLFQMYAILYGDGALAGARVPFAVLITGLVVFMHRANLARIYRHEEPRINLPWTKKDKDNSKNNKSINSSAAQDGTASDIGTSDANGQLPPEDRPDANTLSGKQNPNTSRRKKRSAGKK